MKASKPTAFEKHVLDAAVWAQRTYATLSDGAWLDHGPELVLSALVAVRLNQTSKRDVYLEATHKRIESGAPKTVHRGRRPKGTYRFDLVVWQKADAKLCAIIEIKRAWRPGALTTDAAKIRKYLKMKRGSSMANKGYLLVFSTSKASKTISGSAKILNSFEAWADVIKADRFMKVIRTPRTTSNESYSWGFGLFRIRPISS